MTRARIARDPSGARPTRRARPPAPTAASPRRARSRRRCRCTCSALTERPAARAASICAIACAIFGQFASPGRLEVVDLAVHRSRRARSRSARRPPRAGGWLRCACARCSRLRTRRPPCASATSSAVFGVERRRVDQRAPTPSAPSRIAWRTSSCIRASSAGVGAAVGYRRARGCAPSSRRRTRRRWARRRGAPSESRYSPSVVQSMSYLMSPCCFDRLASSCASFSGPHRLSLRRRSRA